MTKIGIVAEDFSDVQVIQTLMGKLSNKVFSSAPFVGKGSGKLKTKLPAWCTSFRQRGITSIVVVHDRDEHDEAMLKALLEGLIPKNVFRTAAVVIPVQEIEAWLLVDTKAIKTALKLETEPKEIFHPERIASPKERLESLVRQNSKGRQKQYVNAVHNPLIAESLTLSKLKKCPSFAHFEVFVQAALK
jgi:hypothetical protein